MPYLVCESLGLALGRACREASFLLQAAGGPRTSTKIVREVSAAEQTAVRRTARLPRSQ
jgi:hypothetical protein